MALAPLLTFIEAFAFCTHYRLLSIWDIRRQRSCKFCRVCSYVCTWKDSLTCSSCPIVNRSEEYILNTVSGFPMDFLFSTIRSFLYRYKQRIEKSKNAKDNIWCKHLHRLGISDTAHRSLA